VTEVQALLKLLGYYKGPVNGIYEESTASAVSQFQKATGLSSDGIVGTETWSNLLPPAPPATATNPTTAPTIPSTSPVTPESFPAPMPTKPAPPATTTPVTKPANPGSPQPVTVDNVTLPILRLGMKGPAVSGLQERLRALGYLKGGADGVFGPETQSAVKAAQRVLKLEADGVVGSATWLGLLR
jgi:peptidoglycan hydrolase-like protein with peptidoglycan-binding domain